MAAAVNELEKDVRVDVTAIEKSLAELWRTNKSGEDDEALTRAALWNVVAHTATDPHRAEASEILGRASAAVPQRTIVVRSNRDGASSIASWISANCHLIGGGKQVCSEEISIVAGGDHVQRVPPLVNALLIPDMPVAVWWLGDLPHEHEAYVESLLDTADRLIVDSMNFDSPADLVLVSRVAQQTTTMLADLNWVRLEEWRAATASVFDPPGMREHLQMIRRVRIVAGASERAFFGESVESLLFASWITAQVGHHVDPSGKVEGETGAIEYSFERREGAAEPGNVAAVEITFEDASMATITRDPDRGVLTANVGGDISVPESVTRTISCRLEELIVRQLKHTEGDRVLVKVLPIASQLANRVA